jgi:valyl-tRNA synthetase
VRARAFEDGATGDEAAASGSAVASLRLGLSVLVRLLAPVLPYITEEVWSWSFAEETLPGAVEATGSVHRAAWPAASDFEEVAAPDHATSFDTAVAALAAINKAKADGEVSMGRGVEMLRLAVSPATLDVLESVASDVLAAARVSQHEFSTDPALEDGQCEVVAIEFAEREQKPTRS